MDENETNWPEETCLSCGVALAWGEADYSHGFAECDACAAFRGRHVPWRFAVGTGAVLAVCAAIALVVATRGEVVVYRGWGAEIEDLSRRAASDPHNAEVRVHLADRFARLGEWQLADEIFGAALALDPDNARALAERGAVRLMLDRPRDAVSDLEAAVARAPAPDADVWVTLARARKAESDWRGAAEAYRHALAIRSGDAGARVEYAWCLEADGRLDEAAVQLATALSDSPDLPDARRLRERLSMLRTSAHIPDSPVPGVDGVRVPLERWANVFIVRAWLDEQTPVHLVYDTGASLTTISPETAGALGIDQSLPVRFLDAFTAAGPITLPVFRIRSIRIGSARVEDVEVAVCEACAAGPLDGLLGLNFTSAFVTTIDAAEGELLLAPLPGDPWAPQATPSRSALSTIVE